MSFRLGWRKAAAAVAIAAAKTGKCAMTVVLAIVTTAPVLSSLWLVACASESAPSPLLTFFFDNVPPPGKDRPSEEVVKQPRRAHYKLPPPDNVETEIPDLPPPINWRERYDALAKNEFGDIGWVKALDDKVIQPKPGIAADAKDEEVTDMDLEYVPKGQPDAKVIFPHKAHTQWLVCDNCHAGIFEMEKGNAKMTMEKIDAGQYCGVCHSKVATPNLTNCTPCHKAM